MLVLSRKESERIRVGESIVITVVRVAKDRVRLGIEAPDDVLVLRDELEKEDREPRAAKSQPASVPTRAPVQRRSLADFRRTYPQRLPTDERADAPQDEAFPDIAVEEDENISEENRNASPMRRFFRW